MKAGQALSPADAKALITASQDLRLGAAVTLLFCQGWRVSEVLGLAWEDLDLDAGTAQIRRGASYTSSVGMVLGATKTSAAEGLHHLAPVSVAHLRKRRDEQQLEREAMGADWREHVYDGERLAMVFTAARGGLANRQLIDCVRVRRLPDSRCHRPRPVEMSTRRPPYHDRHRTRWKG